MKACLGFFIQRPLLVNPSLLLIIAMGAYSLHNAVISAYPQFDFGAFPYSHADRAPAPKMWS
jgi:hypothetical protein